MAGHRRLTRRTTKAFPDDEAFAQFALGGMRPFAALTAEVVAMPVPTLEGLIAGT